MSLIKVLRVGVQGNLILFPRQLRIEKYQRLIPHNSTTYVFFTAGRTVSNTRHLFPHGHPSGRHSEVDWSDPDLEKFPNFPKTKTSEVILSPGDFMYIPSGWVHYVMSLNTNFQCNARSGTSVGRIEELHRCGF